MLTAEGAFHVKPRAGWRRTMNGKMRTLTAAAAVSLLTGVVANADILGGNFWPNPTFEAASATQPDAPTPWRRGGGDFADPPNNTGPFTFDFWDNAAGTVSGTKALRITDNSTTGNGEWFVPDFAADAAVVLIPPGDGDFLRFRFFWNYETAIAPGSTDGADMRVTIRGDDGIGSFGLGPAFDFLANGTTNGQFVEANFVRPIPAGVTGLRINIASGGSAAVTGFLAVDDLSVTRVPEPVIAGPLLAGLTLLRRRRA